MKIFFWIVMLVILSSTLFSQQIEYTYPRKSYLKELTEPSRTFREDAPEIIASGSVNYIIGGPPVIVAPNITLSNFTEDIEGMKIYFTNNFISNQDILELSTSFPGISENYDQSTGILILEGSRPASFWQEVCRNVQYRNNGSTPTEEIRDVTFTIISAIFIPSTGHYYEFVTNYGISWSDSKAIADSSMYFGLQGYLATILSPEENFFITTELGGVGWIGGSDAEEHNHWKWVCGPEAGTEFWEGLYTGHQTNPGFAVNNLYTNWNYQEPNQFYGDDDPEMWEDYLHMIFNPSVGPVGSWNDLPDAGSTGNFTPHGYVVEYGGMLEDPELNLYGTVQVTVTDLHVTEILPSAGGDITINETESINFSIDAYDPGGNPLTYSWQVDSVEVSTTNSYVFTTDYSSAGLYDITLHVSDGTVSQLNYIWNVTVLDVDVNIIVNDIQPAPGDVTINEAETINFFIDAYDPDGNPLEYSWKLDGTEVSTVSSYDFITDYTSEGTYVMILDVTDNYAADNTINYTWNITVNDVDRPIVVNELLPAPGSYTINETESINFLIDAYDPDGNTLEYSWKLDGVEVSITDSYDFTTDYNSAGTYVMILDVTDNYATDNTINYTWNITVNDVDRPIVVNELLPAPGSYTINELETINFFIDAYDPDGNTLEYSWKLDGTEVSITDSYDFITDYNSAGTYVMILDVTDNYAADNTINYTWNITVNDVDRPIIVTDIQPPPGNITINELETINFLIDAYDPDGNPLEYSWKLDGTEVSTVSIYDYITDYNSAGVHIITLDVTDNFVSDNTLSYLWNITVLDVDQPIVVNDIQPAPGDVTINEAETINFFIDAYDPDGNPLEYSWKLDGTEVSTVSSYDFITDYTSEGTYVMTLNVTDNFGSDNSLAYLWNVTVLDVDRPIVVNELLPAPGSYTINETESINFLIDAYDPDGNPLEYSWKLDGTEVSITDSYNFTTDYNSAGTYVMILDVTDNYAADNTINYTWNITVNDVDRPIVVNELLPAPGSYTINELETINFFIDAYDPDGNTLEYSWKLEGVEVSTESTYDYITDYNSAGEYIITLDVTDNFASDNTLSYLWNITVLDVDQTIVVNELLPAPGNYTINETETINFLIDAYDPDGNTLEYSWQLDGTEVSTVSIYDYITDYNSAGVHIITLDVTDNFVSDNTLSYLWNIMVLDVDQPIVVNDIQPPPGNVTINETETINFFIDAYDPDGNPLEYSWKLDGTEVSTVSSYDFITDYTSEGTYVMTLNVTDNFGLDNSLTYLWNITVLDVDQPIVVNDIQPPPGNITIDELETINFSIDAYDPDGNTLEYSWKLDGTEVSITDSYNFTTDYNSAGTYVMILDVTDNYAADNTINYTWNITVNDVDQDIVVIELIPTPGNITINELETINFLIDAYDPDGNPLEYSWKLDGTEVSTESTYDYITDYNSAGEYIITLDVTDNFASDNTLSYLWNITVLDVDQTIVVNDIQPPPEDVTINEAETINFFIDAYDPDGNQLEYSWKLDGIEVSITDSYNFTTDYNSAGTYVMTLNVTDNFGSDNSLAYLWNVTVLDVDQPIVVNDIQPPPGNVTIDELETINFLIDAYDPDGNPLEYNWNLDGVEVSITNSYDFVTDYNSAGIYIVILNVTDNYSDNSISYSWNVTVNDVDQFIVVNEILPSAGGDITIDELESIAFSIDAYDPDGNPLEYSWQLDGTEVSIIDSYNFTTNYSSAGSYNVTLDVTDNFSDNSISYSWNVTVNDVDQFIVVNEILPSAGGSITIYELESIAFSIDAYDPDGNPLSYTWYLDGEIVSNQEYYQYVSNYNSAGLHTIMLEVTDDFGSDNTLNFTWDVTVIDIDRPIIVVELSPEQGLITMNEGETTNFNIDAYDPDGNDLEYSWQLDGTEVSTTEEYFFITDYTFAGSYILTLYVTDNFASDNSLNFIWDIDVIDVDQEIVVNDILPEPGNIFIQEGEIIDFSIDAYDPDGNALEYNWVLDGTTVSTTEFFEFITNMSSAGTYYMELFVTDNYSDNSIQFNWNITVLDTGSNIIVTNVDPAPGDVELFENDEINFIIEAYAFNGDDLTYNWQLDGNVVSTTNTYLFTTDFTSAGDYVLTLDVEDEQAADTTLNFVWNIMVFESDQPIVVDDIQPLPGEVTISETETINFLIDAYDPDGNSLEYSWKLDGEEVSTIDVYDFITDINSGGVYLVTLDVTDCFSENALYYEWDVTVLETDQNIVIESIQPEPGDITTFENEVIEFVIEAYDPDGNPLEYSWQLDGTQVSTIANYNFLPDYNSAGQYEVTLDITDNFMADNSVSFSWNVTVIDVDQEIIVVELIPDATTVALNEGESVNFSINAYDPDGNELTYSWNLDGTQVSITNSYEFIAATGSTGFYTLTLIVDDNFTDNSLEFTWDITVLDPSGNIVITEISPAPGNLTIDETNTINFFIDAYAQNGDELTYNWMLDDVSVSTEASYDFLTDFNSAGEYVVILTVYDDLSPVTILEFTWNITVTDVDQPIVINLLEPEPGLITMLEMETLSLSIDAYDPDGNDLEYIWELDGTEVSTTDSYDFITTYTSAGEYLITLSVTDNFSDNSLEFEWNVIVEDINPNINIEVIEPTPGLLSITLGDSLNFFIIADNPYGDIYYSWTLDGNEVSIVNNFLFDTNEYTVGYYNLQLIVSTDAITRETIQFIWGISVINSNLPPIADAGEDQYVNSCVLVQLDGSGSYDPEGEKLTYHWIVPEEIVLSDSTIVDPTFFAPDIPDEVEYYIQLIVNDGELNSEPDVVIITVNGNTINDDPVTIPQFTELQCNYPNPFNPVTTIKFGVQDNETATLTIFNLKGQIIENRKFTSGIHNFEWDARKISSGVYFYQLKSSSYTNTRKMILLK